MKGILCKSLTVVTPIGTPQGVQALSKTYKTNDNTQVLMFPGQMAVVNKKDAIDGSVVRMEIPLPNAGWWEYSPFPEVKEEAPVEISKDAP